jgi:3-phenylpropionate/trans-cinnamate dioxygenase ferredoxin subunit
MARERERVAFPKSELGEGERKTLVVRRREIAVFNVGGTVHALFNRCPHQQAPLIAGRIAGTSDPVPPGEFSYNAEATVVRCPWHHYEFDLRQGHCLADPARYRIAVYEVREEGDDYAVYV